MISFSTDANGTLMLTSSEGEMRACQGGRGGWTKRDLLGFADELGASVKGTKSQVCAQLHSFWRGSDAASAPAADFTNCSLQEYTGFGFPQANSISPADIWKVSVSKGENYFMKIYVAPTPTYTASLGMVFEGKVYAKLAKEFLDTGITRNFVRVRSSCENVRYSDLKALVGRSKKSATLLKNLSRNMSWIFCNADRRPSLAASKHTDSEPGDEKEAKCGFSPTRAKYGVLTTEMASGVRTLESSFEEEKDARARTQMLFQLAYTIKLMHEKGLVHQDMHWGNVLMGDVANGDNHKVLYVLGDKSYFIESPKYALIYDWDHAVDKDIENPSDALVQGLDEEWGYGTAFSPKSDWDRFVEQLAMQYQDDMTAKLRDDFLNKAPTPPVGAAMIRARLDEFKKSSGPARDLLEAATKAEADPTAFCHYIGSSLEVEGKDLVSALTHIREEAHNNGTDWRDAVFISEPEVRQAALNYFDEISEEPHSSSSSRIKKGSKARSGAPATHRKTVPGFLKRLLKMRK